MASGLIMIPNFMPALDDDGNPSPGALAMFWIGGTTTPTVVYQDKDLNTAHENPVEADNAGVFPAMYADATLTFNVQVSTASGVTLSPVYEYVAPIGSNTEADFATTPFIVGTTEATLQDRFSRVVDVRDYGAIFDGRDNTAAELAAIAALSTYTGTKIVQYPAGDSLRSATVTYPAGVKPVGQGRNATRISKTADFGDMNVFGSALSPYQSGGAKGIWWYHNYGTGAFPPNTAGGMANPTTTGSIIYAHEPSHVEWEDLWIGSGKSQWYSFGGVACNFRGVESYGVYDPATPVLQEATFGWQIDGDASHIPTDFEWTGCRAAGVISPVRNITWPGTGHVTTTVVANIGPNINIIWSCGESLRWKGGYIGAAATYGMQIKPVSGGLLAGCGVESTFVDACGYSGLSLDNTLGTTAENFTWLPMEHNGQGNGLMAITDDDSNLTNYSVIGLTVGGHYRAFVGPGMKLKRACKVNITTLTEARGWNYQGFYTGNPDSNGFDAFIRIADTCYSVLINGLLGGGRTGDGGTAGDSYGVRYTSAGNPAQVTIGATRVTGTNSTTLSTTL